MPVIRNICAIVDMSDTAMLGDTDLFNYCDNPAILDEQLPTREILQQSEHLDIKTSSFDDLDFHDCFSDDASD